MRNRSASAFSLVEVVVAIGVFVAGVVAAIALLSQTTRSAGTRLEEATAARVAASTSALIKSLAWEDALARTQSTDPWFVDRDGVILGLIEDVPESERFFAGQLVRDETLSPLDTDPAAAFWAGWIELRWPAVDATGAAIPIDHQSRLRTRVVFSR